MLDNRKLLCHSPRVSDVAEIHAPCRRRRTIEPVIKSDHGRRVEDALSARRVEDAPAAQWGGRRANAGRKRQVMAPPVAEGPRWFCVRTLPEYQLTADIEIRLAGFPVFNPSVFKPGTPARRSSLGSVIAARTDRIEPLFPGYLFTQFDRATDNWRVIRRLFGVDYIFSTTPERPVAVPQDALDAIQATLAPNQCLYPPEHRPGPFTVGVRIRLRHGAMAGLDGMCDWSDGQRVRLLLDFMGRRVRVTAAQDSVEAV